MCLDMFLKILGSLEGLSTEFALVRLERNVDADVGGDVVALHCRGSALSPSASKIEVIRRFATDVSLANMLL